MESEFKQYSLLEQRIYYDETIFGDKETYEKVLTNLLEDSKYIALSIKYPFEDYSNKQLPKMYYNWQLRCAKELFQMLGYENIKSYAENGITWTRDGGNISDDLRIEIMPNIGVITDVDE